VHTPSHTRALSSLVTVLPQTPHSLFLDASAAPVAFQNIRQLALVSLYYIHLISLKLIQIGSKVTGCCNLSIGIALNVRFTTNGMCVENNTHIYVARTSNNRVISSGDLYCCLLLRCEALRTCRSSFLIATWLITLDGDVQQWTKACKTF